MAANQIRSVTFRPVAPEHAGSEGGHAVFLALELGDPTRLAGFLEEVVARFKREHLAGPADTRFMLITFTSELAAADFASAWRDAIADDVPARALLGTLHQADVLQTDDRGHVLGQTSLLGDATPAEPAEPDALARS